MNKLTVYILALTLILSFILQERFRNANCLRQFCGINCEPYKRRSALYRQSTDLHHCNRAQNSDCSIRSIVSKNPVGHGQILVKEKNFVNKYRRRENPADDQFFPSCEFSRDSFPLAKKSLCSRERRNNFQSLHDYSKLFANGNKVCSKCETRVQSGGKKIAGIFGETVDGEHRLKDKSRLEKNSACNPQLRNGGALLNGDKLQNIDKFVHRNCRKK